MTGPETIRKLTPVVAQVAQGNLPLDDETAQAVAAVLEHHHERNRKRYGVAALTR